MRIEFAGFFTRSGAKLTDQIFVCVSQCVDVGGEFSQAFGELLDNRAQFGIPVFVLLAEFLRRQVDL